MANTGSIHEFLRAAHVPYAVVPHAPSFTAVDDAAASRTRERDWAKVVVCVVDGEPIQAVLPACLTVNLNHLLALTGGRDIRLAHEHEFRGLFPTCELGAMPPLGPLYGQAVFVDVALAAEPELVFDAGTHTEAIRMRWADFARMVRPVVGAFADPPSFRLRSM